MANTYTQIYIHIVFAVQGRQNFLKTENKEEVQKYITGIIRNKKQKLICINIMPDHVHILLGIKPNIAISDIVRDIKNNSSSFINEKKLVRGKFNWQEGFGAFSYGHSQINAVVKYIQEQEKHHLKKTFREEYLALLKKFDVKYDERYLYTFDEITSK
jgi:REP element-mobilizing transposase RayT